MAKRKFSLEQDEQIIKRETAGHFRGKIRVIMGILILTNKRLVFNRNYNFLFGLIGLIIPSMRGGIEFEFPVNQIASAERTKFGLNKNILLVKSKSGEEHRITLSKRIEEWINEINSLI